jgi:hypothetical protein
LQLLSAGSRRALSRNRASVWRREHLLQVRKIAIMATMKMTAKVPYFTSLMKPS